MKKILSILFAFIFVISAAGCGGTDQSETSSDTVSIVILPDKTTAETVNGYKSAASSEVSSAADADPSDRSDVIDADSIYFVIVANKNSKKYHRQSYRYASSISDKNLTSFSSVQEAESAGYSPCSVCMK